MTDPLMLSKDRNDETPIDSEDDRASDYYYDDSTGYRIYKGDAEDDNGDDQPEEEK